VNSAFRWPRPRGGRPAAPARIAAAVVLSTIDDPRAPGFDEQLDDAAEDLSREDAALAREIAFGVARHRLALRATVGRWIQRPLPFDAADAELALLMGAFQHIHLSRVPAHAIVDDTVRLVAATRGGERFRGLANAVMRRVTERPPEELLPREDAPMGLRHSMPEWIIDEARAAFGDEAEAFLAASNIPAPLCLRVRAAGGGPLEEQLTGRCIPARPGALLADARILDARGFAVGELPAFQEGLVTVEDEGAQVAAELAGRGASGRFLDLCASPGGKTAHLADLAPRASIVATDVSEWKLRRLRETLARLRLTERVDVRLAESLGDERFDLVLVDAPCSGLGTLRRHPEIRWRRDAESIERQAEAQIALLRRASGFVAPGGLLAYTLCTIAEAEGPAVVRAFLADASGFRPDDAPDGLAFDAGALSIGPGTWRTTPHRHGCDGFFVARMRRTG